MLRSFGYDKQIEVEKLSRWDGVKILRDRSSKAASLGVAGNFKKFARGARMTSRMQRDNYQVLIDELFDKQVSKMLIYFSRSLISLVISQKFNQIVKSIQEMRKKKISKI